METENKLISKLTPEYLVKLGFTENRESAENSGDVAFKYWTLDYKDLTGSNITLLISSDIDETEEQRGKDSFYVEFFDSLDFPKITDPEILGELVTVLDKIFIPKQ